MVSGSLPQGAPFLGLPFALYKEKAPHPIFAKGRHFIILFSIRFYSRSCSRAMIQYYISPIRSFRQSVSLVLTLLLFSMIDQTHPAPGRGPSAVLTLTFAVIHPITNPHRGFHRMAVDVLLLRLATSLG